MTITWLNSMLIWITNLHSQGGPWLIYDHYLTARPWSLEFDPKKDEVEKVVVWISLPGLLIQLYDHKLLSFLGNRVGKTIKVNTTTIDQSRGRYARVCVEVDLNKPLLSEYSAKCKILPI